MPNCKVGDLAIQVKSACGNEGRIMTCIEFLPNHEWYYPDGSIVIEDGWITDNFGPNVFGFMSNRIQDSLLRPIRPSDGEDEMIRIAGKPIKEMA